MEGMRDILRSSLRRSLEHLREDDRLAAAWPVACGSALAGHGEVEGLDEQRVLHILVTSSEWMPPFLGMRSTLRNDVSRIAGVPLSGIHFEVKTHIPTARPFESPRRRSE